MIKKIDYHIKDCRRFFITTPPYSVRNRVEVNEIGTNNVRNRVEVNEIGTNNVRNRVEVNQIGTNKVDEKTKR